MSTELNSLFERTMPPDDVILARMAQAQLRSELNLLFEHTMPPDDVIVAKMAQAKKRSAVARDLQWPTVLSAAAVLVLIGTSGLRLLTNERPVILAEENVNDIVPVGDSDNDRTSQPSRPLSALIKGTRATLDSEAESAPSRLVKTAPKPSPAFRSQDALDSPGAESPTATWESAAQALRSSNREEATRLLAQLSASEEPETRDAATLVSLRAVVQKAEKAQTGAGLSTEELSQLRELAESGATASIRASARRLLSEVE